MLWYNKYRDGKAQKVTVRLFSTMFQIAATLGISEENCNQSGSLPVNSPFLFAIITVLVSAAFIPIHLLELGEEIGWREYLLPKQIARYGTHRAALLNGILWGFAHLPLIYFGFNYSLENPGAPWSNIAMMMVVCVTLGIILSYVMAISGNVMFSAIIHGVVNVIGEVPVYLSITQENSLFGPHPTGLIGLSGLIILAVTMFCCFGKAKNRVGI